jgi:YidC/Oxa1 family membrane protein insertase
VRHVFGNVLQPLIDFFEAILQFFHDSVGLGWGMSIVALTVLVRACLLPLTMKQFKSMQNLARHQPELKKLQEKYKNDKERLNQEMMKFYRENKVNPFASCLPLLAQLPVFLSLFYMLQADLRRDICPDVNPPSVANPQPCGPGGEAQFLFIPDLTSRATGWVLIVLVALYIGSQLLSTLLMSTTTDRTQRLIMIGLPFFFVLFVWQFPAGLLVYWITTNLWTIVQQAIVRKRLGPLRPATADGADGGLGALTAMFGGGGGGGAGKSDQKPAAEKKSGDRELVGAGSGGQKRRTTGPPPAPPRKKKKRSGRRR